MVSVILLLPLARRFAEEYLYVAEKVKLWSEEICVLSNFVQTHPHSAYTAFTHGVIHKWSFLMRTVKFIGDRFPSTSGRCYPPISDACIVRQEPMF